ncbi:MAG: tetratricopeptide repeat protein [bacterium]
MKKLHKCLSALLLGSLFCWAGVAHALDARQDIERAVILIEAKEYTLARTYLAPALIAPTISSSERARAYYLRGFTFMAQGMPVSARKDYNRALEFNPNNPVVLLELGRLHGAGQGTVKDEALALSFFERAADLGYDRANFHLGRAYLYGQGVAKNVEAARTALLTAAQQDHLFAMMLLASSYRIAHVTDPQPDLALAWYEKAHAAGAPAALLSMGFMYANGEVGEPDPSRAAALYQQALDAGFTPAAVHLAYAYLTGSGVEENPETALKLYNLAAAEGITDSFVGLGHLYEYGLGVKQDLAQAQSWYEQGAAAGDEDAMRRLVSFFLRQDTAEARAQALNWSSKAADTGSAQSRNDYAWLLATSKFEGLRNGTLAVDQASKAVEQLPTAAFLDTLAAAYAELGNFELAISTQRRAIASIAEDENELTEQLEERLRLYERSEPWRE